MIKVQNNESLCCGRSKGLVESKRQHSHAEFAAADANGHDPMAGDNTVIDGEIVG